MLDGIDMLRKKLAHDNNRRLQSGLDPAVLHLELVCGDGLAMYGHADDRPDAFSLLRGVRTGRPCLFHA